MEKQINITQIINCPICVDPDDGKKVFDEIYNHIVNGYTVNLSFDGIEDITNPFIVSMFDKLYDLLPDDIIESNLKLVDIDRSTKLMVDTCILRIKAYKDDPQSFEDAHIEIFGE